jgi:hypothetical protein
VIHIIGDGVIKQTQAFYDVRDALEFDCDVYLGAMLANQLGIELKNKVIYNMEYLHDASPLWSMGYMEILRNNVVIDFSTQNVRYLKKLGIKAFYMPYGYHESLERAKPSKQDIDVLFVGSIHHPRRQKLLSDLSEKCIVAVTHGVYGEDLDALVSRAKVHLNMHHAEGQPLETVRLNYLMANHCSIVSEHGDGWEKYALGARFENYENLAEACLEALNDPIDGYEIVKQMPMNCKAANEWVRGRTSCR